MKLNCDHKPPVTRVRQRRWRRTAARKRGFLLIMVLLVITTISLAALNFSDAMLIAHEASRLDSKRFQARMMVESGIQAARLFVASPQALRMEMGGTWDNPQKFQALNIVPDPNPIFRGNVSIVAPSLDQTGAIGGMRYGLQNESAKLNLNALVELDKLAKTLGAAGSGGDQGASQGGSDGQDDGGQGGGGQGSSGQGSSGQGGDQGAYGQQGNNSNGNQAGSAGAGPPGGNSGSRGGSGGGGFGGGGFGGGSFGGQNSGLASLAAAGGGQDLAARMLMGLPGMTPDVADAILDFIDADEEPRVYGAEYADYYQQMQPPYKPANGPLASVEQLLLVRGVTPQLLFGYDQNRNGVIDASEEGQMLSGVPAGGAPGAMPLPAAGGSTGADGQSAMPGPLGWAPYLTLHSQEKNVASDGTPRININGDDLQTLYDELIPVVGEQWASYIIAYRIGGQRPPGAASPLQALVTAAASTTTEDGMLGAQLSALSNNSAEGGGNGDNQPKQPWAVEVLASMDLSQQQGSVKFTQILDLVDSSVTFGGQGGGGQGGGQGGGGSPAAGGSGQGGGRRGDDQDRSQDSERGGDQSGGRQGGGEKRGGDEGRNGRGGGQSSGQRGGQPGGQGGGGKGSGQNGISYSSPISSSPVTLAEALPILMDKLTTVDAEAIPGRINIMECPREILAGIPGMTAELVDAILQARADGSETENRRFETWLAVEGLVTIDQMRGLLPLMTCGGDVFKAQVIGYYEGSAPFSRAEAIISGVGQTPTVLFFRRLDHLGRGFDVATLGQRMDVGTTPTTTQR